MGRLTPPAFYRQSPPPTTGELNAERAATMTALGEFVGGRAPETCVIADGVISPTSAFVLVDTEDQSAADELVSINTVLSASDTLHDGMLLYLQARDAGRTVTIKSGVIRTASGSDIVLTPNTWLIFRLESGIWWEVQTSGGLTGDNVFTGNNTFTGEVNVQTPPASDNSTKPATTEWVRSNASGRNPGELVYSLLPLSDAGLHLVDGSLLAGDGTYAEFVAHVAGLMASQPDSSDVFKIGALSDAGNVLSGFSTSSYAKIPFDFLPNSGEAWEMVFKVETRSDVSSAQSVLGTLGDGYGLSVGIEGSKFKMYVSSNGTSWNIANGAAGSHTVLSNATYWIKLEFTGTVYRLSYKLSETDNYATDITVTNTTIILTPSALALGVRSVSGAIANAFIGTIDLKGCYINTGATRWWSGTSKAGFTNESEWQSSVRKYGACGLFVYDSVANTLRLPKVTGIVEGTVDPSALGTLVEAGLPNIEGTLSFTHLDSNGGAITSSGAFQIGNSTSTTYAGRSSLSGPLYRQLDFRASRSNPIYGNSDTVQPQAIKGFVYMVVANRTKTQIQADIDQITADLQLKADADLTNVTEGARAEMARMAAHMGMPSDRYIDLALPASSGGTITAPDDGYLTLDMRMPSGSSWSFYMNMSDGKLAVSRSGSGGGGANCMLPVYKGAVVTVGWGGSFTTKMLYFVYANGSSNI